MAHNNLGICLYDLSQSKEAQLCYKRAIKLKPDYAEPHSNLGNILKDLGNVDEAILSYQKAIKLITDYRIMRSMAWFQLLNMIKNLKVHATAHAH